MINIKLATRKSQVEITKGEWAGNKGVVVGVKDPSVEGGFELLLVSLMSSGEELLVQVQRSELTLIKV